MSERSSAKKSGGRKAGQGRRASATAAEAEANPFATLGFEEALAQLEGIVDRLEEGDLDLADALTRFEEGVQLTKHCHTQLEAAERRVEILTREGGEWSARPFAEQTGDAATDDDEADD